MWGSAWTIGRRRRAHPVNAVVVPNGGVRPRDALPARRGRSVRVHRDRGDRSCSGSGSIQIRGRRTQILVEAARPDAEVRLRVVAEHVDVGVRPVRELELVAELHHVNRHTRNLRRDRTQHGEVVGRPRAAGRVRRRRQRAERDDRDDETQERDQPGRDTSGTTADSLNRRALVHAITLPAPMSGLASGPPADLRAHPPGRTLWPACGLRAIHATGSPDSSARLPSLSRSWCSSPARHRPMPPC